MAVGFDNSVRLWDVDAGTCTAVLRGHTDIMWCLADLGGGRLLSGSHDRSLRVWNTATGACLAVVPDAHRAGEGGIANAVCALPGAGAATGSSGGTVQRWNWDEGASTLTWVGASLRLRGGIVWSLESAPGPDKALQLLAGCNDGALRDLLGGGGASRWLQLQADLAGHSGPVLVLAVMMHGAVAGGHGYGAGM